jgi:hypothetical protein
LTIPPFSFSSLRVFRIQLFGQHTSKRCNPHPTSLLLHINLLNNQRYLTPSPTTRLRYLSPLRERTFFRLGGRPGSIRLDVNTTSTTIRRIPPGPVLPPQPRRRSLRRQIRSPTTTLFRPVGRNV